jgi:regulator of sirC expression with transglutaminase-like and TPR domain
MTGDADRALAAATLALSLSADDPDLLIDRAVAAGSLERWQDAVDDLTHALEEDPRRADAMVLRGSAWRHLGQLDLAEDDIARALEMDPENAEGLLERGIIRQRRNDSPGARADWERAIALSPDSPTADLAQQNLALLEAGPDRH